MNITYSWPPPSKPREEFIMQLKICRENRLIPVRGKGGCRLGEKGEGIKQRKKTHRFKHFGGYRRERGMGR